MLKEEALMQKKLAVKRKALSMLQQAQARALHNGVFGALFAIRWRLPASALQRSSDSVYAAIPLHLEPAWGEESGC